MRSFFYLALGFYLVFMGIIAWCAHQNYDDPENWINWSVFRSFLGAGILAILILFVLLKILSKGG